eukprot:9318371-Prorocentrum_lima.AAC.1
MNFEAKKQSMHQDKRYGHNHKNTFNYLETVAIQNRESLAKVLRAMQVIYHRVPVEAFKTATS